ncbi:hypothetical protein C2S52_014078 [Perilla frutescens var. hirtella]|nr:hypothetical protein C2S52_014078 [Perilla frutescens var. hirtella]
MGCGWGEEFQILSRMGETEAKLLTSDIPHLAKPDFSCLHGIPPEMETGGLCTVPDANKVREAVFGISGDSVSGPDGFTSLFFQHCWDFVAGDVVGAVAEFFSGSPMPRSFTATTIVLLPKKERPAAWTDYRPISLCNVTNKIITKILTARLAPFLPAVLAPNQSSFVKVFVLLRLCSWCSSFITAFMEDSGQKSRAGGDDTLLHDSPDGGFLNPKGSRDSIEESNVEKGSNKREVVGKKRRVKTKSKRPSSHVNVSSSNENIDGSGGLKGSVNVGVAGDTSGDNAPYLEVRPLQAVVARPKCVQEYLQVAEKAHNSYNSLKKHVRGDSGNGEGQSRVAENSGSCDDVSDDSDESYVVSEEYRSSKNDSDISLDDEGKLSSFDEDEERRDREDDYRLAKMEFQRYMMPEAEDDRVRYQMIVVCQDGVVKPGTWSPKSGNIGRNLVQNLAENNRSCEITDRVFDPHMVAAGLAKDVNTSRFDESPSLDHDMEGDDVVMHESVDNVWRNNVHGIGIGYRNFFDKGGHVRRDEFEADDGLNFLNSLRAPSSHNGPVIFNHAAIRDIGSVEVRDGMPVVNFNKHDNDFLADRMGLTLVGKFSHVIPTSAHIDKALRNLQLSGSLFGNPIQIAHATASRMRGSFGKTCVEIDLTKSFPSSILLNLDGIESDKGKGKVNQPVRASNLRQNNQRASTSSDKEGWKVVENNKKKTFANVIQGRNLLTGNRFDILKAAGEQPIEAQKEPGPREYMRCEDEGHKRALAALEVSVQCEEVDRTKSRPNDDIVDSVTASRSPYLQEHREFGVGDISVMYNRDHVMVSVSQKRDGGELSPSRLAVENGHGLGSKTKCGHLYNWIHLHRLSLVVVIEPKLLHVRVDSPLLSQQVFMSLVYGRYKRAKRFELWEQLRDIALLIDGRPWLVRGDFNIFLTDEEVENGVSDRHREMMDFGAAISNCQLIDPGFDGAWFTWERPSTELRERLDRVLLGEFWTSVFAVTRVTHLARHTSDHAPLLVRFQFLTEIPKSALRFQNIWVRHHTFHDTVREEWSVPTGFGGMMNLQCKLKRADEAVTVAQAAYDSSPTSEARAELNRCVAQYVLRSKMEEDFWRQKAAKWCKCRIHAIEDGGRVIDTDEGIRASAAGFFQILLTSDIPHLVEPDFSCLHGIPPEMETGGLCAVLDANEVREAVVDRWKAISVAPVLLKSPPCCCIAFKLQQN